jgi:6-phosphofructokinase 2
VPVASVTGAGDALVGAFLARLTRGDTSREALQWGVAAACATVSTVGTSLCEADAVERLVPLCIVEPLLPDDGDVPPGHDV